MGGRGRPIDWRMFAMRHLRYPVVIVVVVKVYNRHDRPSVILPRQRKQWKRKESFFFFASFLKYPSSQ